MADKRIQVTILNHVCKLLSYAYRSDAAFQRLNADEDNPA
jgi:hypothetical protein